MVKICFVSSLYPPFVLGGAEINVKREAEGLAQRGHQITVIATSPDRKSYAEEVNGVRIYRLSPLNLYPMFRYQDAPTLARPLWHVLDLWNPDSYRAIRTVWENDRPDVVHVNNFKGLSLSVFSVAKRLELPSIFTAHDYSLICPRANLLKSSGEICHTPSRLCLVYGAIQKHLVNDKVSVFTAPSQFVIDRLKLSGLFASARSLKLPYGIETSKGRVEKDYKTIDILYVGAINKHKGIHVLKEVIIQLNQDNVRFHIAGKGENMGEIERLASSNPNVIFHGFVPNEQLVELYQKANVVIVPSIWYEPSAIVILESFHAGTPVIGSRTGGIPELIEPERNGFLFEPGNSEELKAILENLINNPSQLGKLEEGAFQSGRKYGLSEHIDRLEEIYTELANTTSI